MLSRSIAAMALLLPLIAAAQAQERSVTIVLSEEPDIVDPCEASRSNVGRVVKQNVTETLTEIDPDDGSITPRLATEWEQVDDLTWRFKLREGVTFHDGEPFNAETAKTAILNIFDAGNLVQTTTSSNLTVTPSGTLTFYQVQGHCP